LNKPYTLNFNRTRGEKLMADVKKRISEWLNLEQKSLNEISLEDIEFGEAEEQNINKEVAKMLSFSKHGNQDENHIMSETDGLPCKSFWVEDTKDLVLYVWDENQSKTILIPQNGWAIRDDITVH
jgi:hypothetical protein